MSPVTGRIEDEDYRAGNRKYYRREQYFPLQRGVLSEIPEIDENMGLDLRGSDASSLDLAQERALLDLATFDSATVWPEALPEDFFPERIMET